MFVNVSLGMRTVKFWARVIPNSNLVLCYDELYEGNDVLVEVQKENWWSRGEFQMLKDTCPSSVPRKWRHRPNFGGTVLKT